MPRTDETEEYVAHNDGAHRRVGLRNAYTTTTVEQMGNGRWDSSGGDEIEDVYYPCSRNIVFVEELSQCLVRVPVGPPAAAALDRRTLART